MSNESNIIETLWQKNNIKKPRQEICALLKWFCFFLSFCIFVSYFFNFKQKNNNLIF